MPGNDSSLYLEGGFYSSLSSWALGRVGNGFGIGNTVSPAPYLRAAYQWQWNDQEAHVGGTFMYADVNPTVDTFATSNAFGQDRYTDYSVDAGYQFLGDGTHIGTAQAIYTHENQNLNGSSGIYNNANGTALGSNYNLNTFQANVSYWYKNTYGLTLGWQKVVGTRKSGAVSNRPGAIGQRQRQTEQQRLHYRGGLGPLRQRGIMGAPAGKLQDRRAVHRLHPV